MEKSIRGIYILEKDLKNLDEEFEILDYELVEESEDETKT